MSRNLNLAHYRAIKALFGITSVSLGEGGYARLLTLLGRSSRMSTKVGVRIVTTLARLLTLPPTTCIAEVVGAVAGVAGETWVESAWAVARSFQVQVVPTWATLPAGMTTSQEVRRYIKNWKQQVVVPAAQISEAQWWTQTGRSLDWTPPAHLTGSVALTRRILWTQRTSRACILWFLAFISGKLFRGFWNKANGRH